MQDFQVYLNQFIALIVEYLPRIIGAIVVWFIGSWLVSRIAGLATRGMELRNLDVSLRTFLKSLLGIGLKVLLLISIAGMVGIKTDSFVAILGAAGLAIGLALQSNLGNLAGGVLILIFKPFKVGDVISTNGQTGTVKEINVFNTILTAPDNRTILLPNGAVSNGVITNFSVQGTLGFDIQIEVDGKHDFEKIKAVAMEVLQADSRVISPSVGIAGFGAGTKISIKGQAKSGEQETLVGNLNEKIQAAFYKNGFGCPEVHTYVHNVDLSKI
jgi:small conductance mechanosensitive channel